MLRSKYRRLLCGLFAVSAVTYALVLFYRKSNLDSNLASNRKIVRVVYEDVDLKTTSQRRINKINKLLEPQRVTNINCSRLYQGDDRERDRAGSILKAKPYQRVSESAFVEASRDCHLYVQARKYVTFVSHEERAFPLAYSIVIHHRIEQFERLLRAIYRPNNYYCVHVDKKASAGFLSAVKGIADCFQNVFIASKLEVVVYGGFTRLQADVNCMQDLLKNFTDWKYVLNMAGSEMPLKTNLEMVKHLKRYKSLNIVGKITSFLNRWRWRGTYSTVVTGKQGRVTKINAENIPPPHNINMTKGSAYAILSRPMVDYIFTDPVPKAFLEWNKSTYSPDEQFWATLNNLEMNPELKTPGGNACPGNSNKMRAVLWHSPSCQGKNVRTICVFGVGDLPWVGSRTEFVLNKLDLEIDYIAYQCVEELLTKRSESEAERPWDIEHHRPYLDSYDSAKCKHNG